MRSKIAFAAVTVVLVSAAAHGQDLEPAAPSPAKAAPAAAPHPLEGLRELRMERNVWWPNLVPGSLAVSSGPAGV